MWKRKMLACLRLEDIELLSLQPQPAPAEGQAQDAAAQAEWKEKTIKSKSNIVLTLGIQPTTALAKIIDDDQKYAKDLWDVIAKLYTTTNTQAIINLK